MSTISEVDIRDWEKINFVQLRKDIEHARYEDNDQLNIHPYDAYSRALDTVEFVERLRDNLIKEATKNVAALFKPKE